MNKTPTTMVNNKVKYLPNLFCELPAKISLKSLKIKDNIIDWLQKCLRRYGRVAISCLDLYLSP